jgi:hypothetical protein
LSYPKGQTPATEGTVNEIYAKAEVLYKPTRRLQIPYIPFIANLTAVPPQNHLTGMLLHLPTGSGCFIPNEK